MAAQGMTHSASAGIMTSAVIAGYQTPRKREAVSSSGYALHSLNNLAAARGEISAYQTLAVKLAQM